MTLALPPARPFRLADHLESLVWVMPTRTGVDLHELHLLLTPGGSLPQAEIAGTELSLATASREAAQRAVLLSGAAGVELRWTERMSAGRHRHASSFVAGTGEHVQRLLRLARHGAGLDIGDAAAPVVWRAAVLACSRVRTGDGSLTIRFPTAQRAATARAAAQHLGLAAVTEPPTRGELRHRVRLEPGEAALLVSNLLGR